MRERWTAWQDRRELAREDALMRSTGGKGLFCSLGAPPPRGVQQIQAQSGHTATTPDLYDFDD